VTTATVGDDLSITFAALADPTRRAILTRLEAGKFDTAAEWIGRHRQMWQDRYDRLDEHISALRLCGPSPASKAA